MSQLQILLLILSVGVLLAGLAMALGGRAAHIMAVLAAVAGGVAGVLTLVS